MAKHFIKKCECGAVISQCRCISEHKDEEIITHKEHMERIEWRQEADKAELEIPQIEDDVDPVEEMLARIDDENIPITLDFQDNLENLLGYFVPPNVNPKMKMIANMLAAGYTFELSPSTINGKLVGVSIISHSMKAAKKARWESTHESD